MYCTVHKEYLARGERLCAKCETAAGEYHYVPQPITPERRAEIFVIVDGLRDDAQHDVEDFRTIYEALIDLLNVVRVSFPKG